MFSEEIKNKHKWDPSYGKYIFCAQKYDLYLCFILKRCEGECLEIKYSTGRITQRGKKKLKWAKKWSLSENVIRNINITKMERTITDLGEKEKKSVLFGNLTNQFQLLVSICVLSYGHLFDEYSPIVLIDKLKAHNWLSWN